MKRIFQAVIFFSVALISSLSFAQENIVSHYLIMPSCLVSQIKAPYHTLSKTNSLVFIKTTDAGLNQLVEAKAHGKQCGGFRDVTLQWQNFVADKTTKGEPTTFLKTFVTPPAMAAKKYTIRYQSTVEPLLLKINPQTMWTNLTTLAKFTDRYANSNNGVKAAAWIKDQVETMIKNSGRTDTSVYYIDTGNYKQKSVVAKMGNADDQPAIVIGGHMDTLNSTFELKPGADDDGTGTVTVLETAETLLNSGLTFKKNIYFIWYAAEEEGLVGSGYVVDNFKKNKIPVDAVIQFDMTGYEYKNDPTMWLMDDYVNKDLTTFLAELIKTYVKQPVKHSKCGYACSDHASWNDAGYSSSIAFETSMETYNPYIHTAQDTMEKLSLDHMSDFAKLATAFAVELAEPAN